MGYPCSRVLVIAAGLMIPTVTWAGVRSPLQLGGHYTLFRNSSRIHCNKHPEGNQISCF